MNIYYVYMYLDLDNIPFYIGKGKDNRCNIHDHLGKQSSNNFLKNKIRKVGIDNITIHFLHKDISEKEAFSWERYWIKYIGRRDKKGGSLCNLTDGGEGSSGLIFSTEHRRKISKALKGHKTSKETRRKISESNKGKPHTDEHNQKVSKTLRGYKHSEETRRKMSECQKGKKHSKEAKQKIGDAKKGKKFSDEHKRRLSNSLKGRKLSKNHKRKIGEARIGKHLSEEGKQKISEANKGRPSPMKGKKLSNEHKRKISETKRKLGSLI